MKISLAVTRPRNLFKKFKALVFKDVTTQTQLFPLSNVVTDIYAVLTSTAHRQYAVEKQQKLIKAQDGEKTLSEVTVEN